MNLEEFLDALSKTPRLWKIYGFYRIRLSDHAGYYRSACPLCAVAAMEGSDYPVAANKLGIDALLATTIANAADGAHGVLRARLLKACGLE